MPSKQLNSSREPKPIKMAQTNNNVYYLQIQLKLKI
jgi:hypothetical protein